MASVLFCFGDEHISNAVLSSTKGRARLSSTGM